MTRLTGHAAQFRFMSQGLTQLTAPDTIYIFFPCVFAVPGATDTEPLSLALSAVMYSTVTSASSRF